MSIEAATKDGSAPQKSRRPSLVRAVGVGSLGEETSHPDTTESVSGSPATGHLSIGAAYGKCRSKLRATHALLIGTVAADSAIHQRPDSHDEQHGRAQLNHRSHSGASGATAIRCSM